METGRKCPLDGPPQYGSSRVACHVEYAEGISGRACSSVAQVVGNQVSESSEVDHRVLAARRAGRPVLVGWDRDVAAWEFLGQELDLVLLGWLPRLFVQRSFCGLLYCLKRPSYVFDRTRLWALSSDG